ncbi:chemotaxis protein CheB [Litoreibacter roseus]|uniref:protein-glutamate methylesterase n=1 Tax=Litoreibacter roseus TaxID=2601869 RepID=A0A6N6JHM4_9RHOB|nr:chemotaxis protein CheB [Litoreibacter roseus]GFE65831.1 hypothetical protein KIN_29050 [Litoreibacter roseus]
MSETKPTDGYVVAIGASAGGLAAVKDLIAHLPKDLNAAVVIAIHSGPKSKLAEVLETKSPLPVRRIQNGDSLRNGHIYVVPGGQHAFFREGRLTLSDAVSDSGFRPSIDALFMTLAAEHGKHGIAVVLSGTMNDGVRGAQVIYDMGGTTVVQDPEDAEYDSMPLKVIHMDHPKEILSASDLGSWLSKRIGRSEN